MVVPDTSMMLPEGACTCQGGSGRLLGEAPAIMHLTPAPSCRRHHLPPDVASGGVSLRLDTLNGAKLEVLASPDGLALRDGSALTPDSQVVAANLMVR